jgi:mono/diheme cytochrome c family protein
MKRSLMASIFALMLIGPFAAGTAQANPFPKGNAAAGKKLHDAKCAQCHSTMFPDKDGTQLYSDLFRKIENPKALQGMVQACATRSNAGWFDEEILNVTRYLNDTYYKFK